MMLHKCRGRPFKTSTPYWFHAQARLLLGMVGDVLHLGLVPLTLILHIQATNDQRGRGFMNWAEKIDDKLEKFLKEK